MKQVLTQDFFDRPTRIVARELLGCFLCRRIGKRVIRLQITEVEVYDGFKDRASHAYRGQTPRNAPMFGEAGRWYVYFTYGMHWMLNIVTGPVSYPAAVLIRAGVHNSLTIVYNNVYNSQTVVEERIDGPARLTKFLKIDKRFNNKKAGIKTGLWIERGRRISDKKIMRTPRIGVAYAGPVWSRKLFRFILTR